MQFLYDGLGITTGCESGYRASVNPRLHIEFALMRMAFLMKKPEGAPAVAAPVAAPVATVQTPVVKEVQTPAATVQKEVTQTTAPVAEESKPATVAVPAASEEPATDSAAAEQPRERRTRAARANAGLSMKAVMSEEQPKEQNINKEAPAPTEEEIRQKWPELALRYKHLDRLCSMLNTTVLSISDHEDGCKMVIFQVVNEAQKTWVEAKMLHDLEGNLRAILKSMKLYLRVEVAPDDSPREKKIYMPREQAEVLRQENSEVNSLIQDLALDTK
jgi:DNA polymerase-3 subunit gamma/tau